MNCGGRAYYDELTARCGECGWSAAGVFPDGRPYLACRLCGYILHGGPTPTPCTGFATPERAAELRGRWREPDTRRARRTPREREGAKERQAAGLPGLEISH